MKAKFANLQTDTKISLLLIFIIVIFSYWQILLLNIWQDDNALIFKVQHFTERAGVFGSGAAGAGAYRYIALPFIPIQSFFGSNLTAYYFLCLVFYAFAALSVYFLGVVLFKSKQIATFSALIFAAGFVGLEGVTRLFNSIQTSYSIIFTCLTFALLYVSHQKKIFWSYLLAVPLFYFTIETGYIRTQYLILPVVALFFVNAWQKNKIIDKLKEGIFLIPFVLIYYTQYFSSPDPRSSSIKTMISNLLIGQWEYLHGLFGSIGNIFLNPYLTDLLFNSLQKIPGSPFRQLFLIEAIFIIVVSLLFLKKKNSIFLLLVNIFWIFLQRPVFQKSDLIPVMNTAGHIKTLFATFVGGEIIFIMLFYLLTLKENGKKFLGLFLLLWLIGNALAYSFYLPLNPLETTNRYLTHSLAPLSLLMGLIFLYMRKNIKVNLWLICLLILINVFSANKFLYDFRHNVSIPTKNFYSQLKNYVPSFNKGAIFYFDVDNDPIARQQFRDFFSVGSMPESTAIAIRYGVDRYDFNLVENLDELQQKISQEKTDISDIYSFFYRKNSLINTTDLIREGIKKGYRREIGLDQQKTESYPSMENNGISTNVIGSILAYTNLDFPSVLPVKIVVEGSIREVELSKVKFPLLDLSRKTASTNYSLKDKVAAIQAFKELSNFRNIVQVEDLPSERLHETKYLIDGDLDSYWRYHRGLWDKQKGMSVTFDLGSVKQINQIRWVNVFSNSTPTFYSFKVSSNNREWKTIKEVKRVGKLDGQEIVEKIDSVQAKLIRFVVEETFDNDSPVIAEVSAINSESDLTEENIRDINYLPYGYVKSVEELNELKTAMGKVTVPLFWTTNKDEEWKIENMRNIMVLRNGFFREEVIIPAGGTILKEIKIGPASIPSHLKIDKIYLKTM